ncbi:hypothetical protein Hanom_Chr01g00088811 [Helianthus anomalus]
MKGSGYKHNVYKAICKLSKCVCVYFDRMLSLLSVCILLSETHCMCLYTQTQQVWSKDPIDVSKDHLSMLNHSNDQEY